MTGNVSVRKSKLISRDNREVVTLTAEYQNSGARVVDVTASTEKNICLCAAFVWTAIKIRNFVDSASELNVYCRKHLCKQLSVKECKKTATAAAPINEFLLNTRKN